ncbi:hypothetical protein RIF29_38769 [Crotalaria pallida]|uniref:Uncharacterized protein n=1 Tax=Crotalaria pallida TaxID=3830 RepID=A0AAN9E0F8_CROPI
MWIYGSFGWIYISSSSFIYFVCMTIHHDSNLFLNHMHSYNIHFLFICSRHGSSATIVGSSSPTVVPLLHMEKLLFKIGKRWE